MNIVVGLFSVYFALNLIQKKVAISREARIFLYLGVALPVVDYCLRFTVGEIWFQSNQLIFHSFIYQALFWGTAALLNWVYSRHLRSVGILLLPLLGLLINALFSVLSMENVSFLAPFSGHDYSLGWVTPGYLVPTAIMVVLWFTLLGSDLSKTLISSLALGCLVVFIVYSATSYYRINQSLRKTFPNAEVVSLAPVNHQQTMWRGVVTRQDKYVYTHFHFVQGQSGSIEEQAVQNRSALSQSVLLDPRIRTLFMKAFRNPVIQVDIQNESMMVSISELVPLVETLWVKQVRLRKNKSGQIVNFEVEYGTIL